MDYSQLGIDSVSDKHPSGSDVRYEKDFEALQAEIDKLASPTERDSFEWSVVTELASGILKEQSKDILVASYLCVGLIHLNGGTGLDQATKLYDDLITTFWDTLFPLKKRMRRREAAIEWWIEKTEAALENDFQLKVAPDVYETILERLIRIDNFLEQDDALNLSAIKLINMIKNYKPEDPTGEKKETPATGTIASAMAGDLPDIEITNAEDAIKSLGPLFQKIRQASKVVREDNAHKPQSYRWLRFALWETVKSLPAATDGTTRLLPPAQQMLTHLETLKNDEDWKDLLLASESALNNPKNIFLIDLNRLTAEALLNLGRKYREAYDIVCHETYLFINRLTGVENLSFSDGTPFASGETKEWLKTITPGDASNQDVVALPVSGEESSINEVISEARKMLKEKAGITGAVSLLQQKINNSFSKKEALLLRLGLVQILVAEKKDNVAVPHLDLIFNDFKQFRLDLWEPDIALKGLKVVYTVFKKQSDKKYQQKAEEVFSMITGISTVDAIHL